MGTVDELRDAGVERGSLVAVAAARDGVALAAADETWFVDAPTVGVVEHEVRPRWVMWSSATAIALARAGVRLATSWDLVAVHRLLFGGWRAPPALVWAAVHDLPLDRLPTSAPPDLFSAVAVDDLSPEEPVRADGYLRPDWADGAWAVAPARAQRWAQLALAVCERQDERLVAITDRPRLVAVARVESTAELLCAELALDGLPVDRAVAEGLVHDAVGVRPSSEVDAAQQRAQRDAEVLRHAPPGTECDLRSPGQVKSLLRRAGIEVPDTRASRLEALRDTHPLVDALLVWRKAERVSTTYGYRWLDEHLDDDGRLRGEWSGSDGAAGRMTASAGLHNLPVDMRAAVVAEPGHAFVRADLGQIEPRVLAAVSGDAALARATDDADLYAPVARELGVDRATAKVAVLGAMYGQTTGHGARALRRLEQAYPVAMAYLREADEAAQVGRSLRTYGGRLVVMHVERRTDDDDERDVRSRAAARGRYGRNAMVQGAAAEFFKTWAVTVRARGAASDARIVLCLHDELLVHAPAEHAENVAQLVDECLREAAHRWAPDGSVRFVADISVVHSWAEAKERPSDAAAVGRPHERA
jgi:DNA polymerase-1